MDCLVGNVRLYYEVCGSGTPLVMVHGNGEDHTIFDTAVRTLSERYRVYTPDSRCHGRSTDTETLTYEAMADDTVGFIRALALKKPVFYGFSDGGIIGLLIALRAPDLLGTLIVSGANLNPRGFDEATRRAIHKEALAGSRLSRLMDTEPDIAPKALRRIKVPTAVLAGEHDLILPEHTRLIAASVPGARLEILPGEDHGSYVVHSEKLAPIIAKYAALLSDGGPARRNRTQG